MVTHLEEGRRQAAWSGLAAIDYPLLVCAAAGGETEAAIEAAVACLFVYLGADLLDNVADREVPPLWHGRSEAEISLAATTLIAALPQLALHELAMGDVAARLSRMLAGTLMTMSRGQHEDLTLKDPTPAECRATAERKAGAEFALFAATGAAVAGAPEPVVDAYSQFGFCVGTANQLASDLEDLMGEEPGNDLAGGKRTLPIAHALVALPEPRRDELETALRSAAHDAVQDLLREAGSPIYVALVVGTYRRRAARALAGAAPQGDAGEALRRLIDRASVVAR